MKPVVSRIVALTGLLELVKGQSVMHGLLFDLGALRSTETPLYGRHSYLRFDLDIG